MKNKKLKKRTPNDGPSKGFKKFIEETVSKIQGDFGLTDFKIDYIYSNEEEKMKDGGSVWARISIDPRYLRMTVTLCPSVSDDFNSKRLNSIEELLCHEMAHARTEPLVRLARARYILEENIEEEREKLTEIIGRLMYQNMSLRKK